MIIITHQKICAIITHWLVKRQFSHQKNCAKPTLSTKSDSPGLSPPLCNRRAYALRSGWTVSWESLFIPEGINRFKITDDRFQKAGLTPVRVYLPIEINPPATILVAVFHININVIITIIKIIIQIFTGLIDN